MEEGCSGIEYLKQFNVDNKLYTKNTDFPSWRDRSRTWFGVAHADITNDVFCSKKEMLESVDDFFVFGESCVFGPNGNLEKLISKGPAAIFKFPLAVL